MIEIKIADLSSLSLQQLERIYTLLRDAYAITEREIWGENYSRMSFDQFRFHVKKREFLYAEFDGVIVGSIHHYRVNENTFSFGSLSADFSKKGNGIGRKLIAAAESSAKQQGATKMTLEILRPRDYELPFKTVLREWYLSQNYFFVATSSFLELKRDQIAKAKLLKVPVVFDCYEKLL